MTHFQDRSGPVRHALTPTRPARSHAHPTRDVNPRASTQPKHEPAAGTAIDQLSTTTTLQCTVCLKGLGVIFYSTRNKRGDRRDYETLALFLEGDAIADDI